MIQDMLDSPQISWLLIIQWLTIFSLRRSLNTAPPGRLVYRKNINDAGIPLACAISPEGLLQATFRQY